MSALSLLFMVTIGVIIFNSLIIINHLTRIEKKIDSKKSHHKGRKILGKSLQGHSPYMNNIDYRIISF